MNFTGEDESEKLDGSLVDTRTRLRWIGILNENLKFVNRFEFDTVWGDVHGDNSKVGNSGRIGADGKQMLELKWSYADFNIGPLNAKIGIQPVTLGRAFLFDDDFSGANISFNGDGVTVPFVWIRGHEGDLGKNIEDVDYFVLAPSFDVANMLTINPYGVYGQSDRASGWSTTSGLDDLNMFFVGLDLDANIGPASLWFTGIYQGGSADLAANPDESIDFKGYLGAFGGEVPVGPAGLHGQFFYASGDDEADDEIEEFSPPRGAWYYWAEILGYGTFDYAAPVQNNPATSNSPFTGQVGNIWAGNLGATFSPMEKLSFGADVWYASWVEVPEGAEEAIGTEIDLSMTYELVQNLYLDVVGAYLIADDGFYDGPNDANPYEVGTRLSLSF
jgi:hypothetical protein